jgi:hypothetical protein
VAFARRLGRGRRAGAWSSSAPARELRTAWPRARLLPVDGRGHRRLLADADTIVAASAFVLSRAPQPPRTPSEDLEAELLDRDARMRRAFAA